MNNPPVISTTLGILQNDRIICGITTQIFENIARTLGEFDADLSDVVKCQVFLGDMADFGEMNAAYAAALPSPKPTRSTFGANGLALGAALEIECMAIKQ